MRAGGCGQAFHCWSRRYGGCKTCERPWRGTPLWFSTAGVASKEQRRLSMAMRFVHLPFVHTLEVFEFEAQPSRLPKSVIKLWRQVLSHLPAPTLP